jgi:hypothetical protein
MFNRSFCLIVPLEVIVVFGQVFVLRFGSTTFDATLKVLKV